MRFRIRLLAFCINAKQHIDLLQRSYRNFSGSQCCCALVIAATLSPVRVAQPRRRSLFGKVKPWGALLASCSRPYILAASRRGSELMAFFIVPSNLLVLAAVLGFILLARRRRAGAIVAACSLAAIVVAAFSPLGNMLLTPLEQRFPDGQYPTEDVDGIVVLGGSYDTVSHSYLSTIVLEEDTEPLAVMVDLARRYPKAKVIFSGGSGDSGDAVSEAAIVKGYFISLGIAPDRILTEGQSQTTAENARFTADLLHPTPGSRWLLVTSGYHMPRAVGAFRQAGFDVVAFPAGLRTHGWREMWRPESTATDNLRRVDISVHEWVGLLNYKLKGYSHEWFPAPAR